MTHRRTQTRPDVAGTGDGLAGQRDDALGQWLAVNHRTFHRVGGPHVLHQHADVGRTAPVGDLFAGQDLRQLFCPAGRVFGRDHSQGDIVAVRQYRTQHRNGLRFIVLNTDQHFAGLQNMRKNANPFHHLRGTVLHQTVIGGDVRFALGGVDDQRFDFIAAAVKLSAGREACAPQTRHAELMNAFNQRFTAVGTVVAPAVTIDPAVFTIGFNDHAQLRQRRRMGNGMGGNSHHLTGSRGMYRQHPSATKGQRLAAKNAIAFFHAQFAFRADMLFQGHNVTGRQRDLAQRRAVRLRFHLRRMNAAVEIPDLLFSEGRK